MGLFPSLLGGDSPVLKGLQQITANGGCLCFGEQKKGNKGGTCCPVLLPPHGEVSQEWLQWGQRANGR